jgi:adenosylcobinamide kinase / adenosylcobinamide-phosphate guanylyltransferase
MAHIALILGGVRSGKSRFAQDLAQKMSGDDVLFIATAEAGDAEMSRRIQIHRMSRPASWPTLEVPQNVGASMQRRQQSGPHQRTVLIDCLTLLVSNVLLSCGDHPDPAIAEQCVDTEIQGLLAACEQWQGTVIIVSGEVGLGVVPESVLGRQYRDLLGWANQAVAARSKATYLMVAGLPIELKSLANSVEQAASKIEILR